MLKQCKPKRTWQIGASRLMADRSTAVRSLRGEGVRKMALRFLGFGVYGFWGSGVFRV